MSVRRLRERVPGQNLTTGMGEQVSEKRILSFFIALEPSQKDLKSLHLSFGLCMQEIPVDIKGHNSCCTTGRCCKIFL